MTNFRTIKHLSEGLEREGLNYSEEEAVILEHLAMRAELTITNWREIEDLHRRALIALAKAQMLNDWIRRMMNGGN